MSIDDSEFEGAFQGGPDGGLDNEPEQNSEHAEVAAAPEFELQVPETGDPGLDETLRELARASAIPLEDQLPVIEAVHRSLQDRLADVEG